MSDLNPDPPARAPYTPHPDAPEYHDEQKIVCPYCLYEDHEPGEYRSLERDGDETEFECPECDQVSNVSMRLTREYLAEPIDPEVPRKPFEVTATLEGEQVTLSCGPKTTGTHLLIPALIKFKLDPFFQGNDCPSNFYLENASGSPLRMVTSLVSQGVRAGHHLIIKRKSSPP